MAAEGDPLLAVQCSRFMSTVAVCCQSHPVSVSAHFINRQTEVPEAVGTARVRRTRRLYLAQHTWLSFRHKALDVTRIVGVTGDPGADPEASAMGSGHLSCPPRLRGTLK